MLLNPGQDKTEVNDVRRMDGAILYGWVEVVHPVVHPVNPCVVPISIDTPCAVVSQRFCRWTNKFFLGCVATSSGGERPATCVLRAGCAEFVRPTIVTGVSLSAIHAGLTDSVV